VEKLLSDAMPARKMYAFSKKKRNGRKGINIYILLYSFEYYSLAHFL
jgi:hypothetical protein